MQLPLENKRLRRRLAVVAFAIVTAAAGLVITQAAPASATWPLARAELRNGSGAVIGNVTFVGRHRHGDTVWVDLRVPADAPGLGAFHGLHVHTVGQCVAPFTTAGGHWNVATGATHGQHTGDLPSVLVGPDGKARLVFDTQRFDVNELTDADGSAVILHAGADNFGNVPIGAGKYEDPNDWYNNVDPAGTARTGDAGSRYACGVVKGL